MQKLTNLIQKMKKLDMNTRLSSQRRKDIIELAEFIAKEHFLNESIKPEIIAQKENIKYKYGSYGSSFDGILRYKNQKFYIFCNLDKTNQKNTPRVRFTFCHELGHYFIDEHRNTLIRGKDLHHPSQCDFKSKNIVEQEADLFASHLLIPGYLLKKEALRKKAKVGIEEILYLSSKFKSSLTCTTLRYVELNIIPCAVFIWDNKGELKWHWKSMDIYSLKLGKPITSLIPLGNSSATNMALVSGNGNIYKTGSLISAFFPSSVGSYSRNAILYEEAIKIGEYGVMTLVYPEDKKYSYHNF